jgi:hypothetical protein
MNSQGMQTNSGLATRWKAGGKASRNLPYSGYDRTEPKYNLTWYY